VHLSEQENQLVVSTDNKQEIFVFDHVAHQATSQLDIYRMIGQEAVQASLEVCITLSRDITAASLHTDRLAQAKLTRLWEISVNLTTMATANQEEYCLD
jgi:hypothetical protein